MTKRPFHTGSLKMNSDGFAAFTGATWLTSPFWLQFAQPIYQVILAAMGFALLVLTLRLKWMDIKIKRATLAEIEANLTEVAREQIREDAHDAT